MALKLLSRKSKSPAPPRPAKSATKKPAKPYEPAAHVSLETDDLKRHIQLERYGVVAAHPERWRNHAGARAAFKEANDAIDEAFGLVPEGCASLPMSINDSPGCAEQHFDTSTVLIARYAVTHAQFQHFVDAGGYDDLDLWPEDIWPHLIDFKDLTDRSGPRFWRDGRHDRALSDHPVVGVSSYEAAAYAAWAGYRLPTEAEWQVAASWRIRSSAYVLRRYPWGDSLDKRKCNIWASGIGSTMPVTAFEDGAAPNGVRQLVGNVWEWTSSDFEVGDEEGRSVVGDMIMRSVRGGAFDTYFPAQATSFFRSGLASLVRAHNTGFRCALDLRDVSPPAGSTT